jgi:hypothetical protein
MPRLRSFRRGAAVTTEDCRWFYKSRAKATSREKEKTEKIGGKTRQNRETERLGTKEKLGETEDRNP